jgi:hypothetical protein
MRSLAYSPLLAILVLAVLPQMAFAYDSGGGPSSQMTLEQELELAHKRVEMVKAHPGEGSGTPLLSANGVVGSMLITGGVFGGIFVAFVLRAKQMEKIRTSPFP